MNVVETALPEVKLITPKVWPDDRGWFFELHVEERYEKHGIPRFVQDNVSRSVKGTLRGLHFQEPNAQGKLVQPLTGVIYDVAVDVRRGSPTFGRWVGVELSGAEPRQIWIPPGFAHGFCVISESADVLYKCTTPYAPQSERSIRWDDPELGIQWPVTAPKLSKKDAAAPTLSNCEVLPSYR